MAITNAERRAAMKVAHEFARHEAAELFDVLRDARAAIRSELAAAGSGETVRPMVRDKEKLVARIERYLRRAHR
jgi:hypothetical protein